MRAGRPALEICRTTGLRGQHPIYSLFGLDNRAVFIASKKITSRKNGKVRASRVHSY